MPLQLDPASYNPSLIKSEPILEKIDMTLAENEQEFTTPHAADHENYSDEEFLRVIDLIRTHPGKLYNLEKFSVDVYDSWKDLLVFLQDSSLMDLWFNDKTIDEEDADETSIDFERYSIYLEEIIYQLMYDLSLVARGFMGYGGMMTADLKDGVTDKISGSGLSKVMAMHLFGNEGDKHPMSGLTATTYEIDRLTLIYPYLSAAQQLTVQDYMDWAIPRVFPHRAI
jgi:hypothetical protein